MDNEKQKWKQLASYFAGDCSEEEQQQLEASLKNASPEELARYMAAKKLWENASTETGDFNPDLHKAWQQVQLKIGVRKRSEKRIPYSGIAAAIALTLVAGYLLINGLLANRPSTSEMTEVSAEDEVEFVRLTDGSQVWLNKGARLSYSKEYSVNNREVHLIGEAFFEVQKAEGKRFTIFTKTTKTEVIGTSFNLRAIPDEPVKVQVTTGKVAFSNLDKKESVFLEPGLEAVYTPEAMLAITTKPIEDQNYRAWQNKELIFKNTPLSELIKTLEEYFQTEIILAEPLKKCRFTSNFKNPQLKEVLDVLALTGNFRIEQTTNGYILTGEACNTSSTN